MSISNIYRNEVTLVNPAIVVELAPKLIDVEPTVTA